MKCPICGKQTLPGAKLCGPCRSALKRARDDSVWEMPGTPTASRADASSDTPAPASRWVLGSARLAGWRGVTVAALLVAIGAAGGTILTRSADAGRDHEPPAAPAAVIVQPAAPVAPAVEPTPPAVAAPVAAPAREEVVQPPRHEPPHAKPRPAPEPPPVLAPAPVEPPPAVVEPPKPAPAPVKEPPRPVDPWQRMSEALARCKAEDVFGRIGCEYRVRASFCAGHWGENAQCPGAPLNDHGQ